MTSHKRGDVVLVLFPNSDLGTFKRRPALVVQANDLGTGLPQVVVAMITSNPERRGYPSRVFVPLNSPAARMAGLRTDSIVMADNLATVLDKAIVSRLGQLNELGAVDAALRKTLAL